MGLGLESWRTGLSFVAIDLRSSMDSMTGDAPVRPVVESGDTGAWKASEAEEDSASMLSRLGRLRLRSRHKSSTKYTHTISILRQASGHCEGTVNNLRHKGPDRWGTIQRAGTDTLL